MHVEFNIPTSFMAMREQQLLELKFNNFNQATQNPSIAPSYAQKYYLGLNDDMMKENREWLRKDSALKWELTQIESMGPNFREQLAAQAGVTPGAEGGALPAGGGGGGAGIPEFGGGAAPEAGGEEGGAEAVAGPAPGVGAGSPVPPSAGAPENTQGLAPTQGSPQAQQSQT